VLYSSQQLQSKRLPLVFKEQALRFMDEIFTVTECYFDLYNHIQRYHKSIRRLELRGPVLSPDGQFRPDVKESLRMSADHMRDRVEVTTISYATAYMLLHREVPTQVFGVPMSSMNPRVARAYADQVQLVADFFASFADYYTASQIQFSRGG
jgi:hypothetical protein